MLRKWPILLVLMAGLIVFGVACSDDDDDSDPEQLSAPTVAVDYDEATETVTWSWNNIANAENYRLQVAAANDFASPMVDMVVEGTEYMWDVAEVATGTYYARTLAQANSADYLDSDWSAAAEWNRDTKPVVTITGTITEDMTLTSDKDYLLSGGVFVGLEDPADPNNKVTLTIEAGTEIIGQSGTDAMLVVARGGKIMAEGTADAPIVFTSDQPEGERAPEDWGGVIINGFASLNTGDTAEGEGGTGTYGGTNDSDGSGTMRYCRIEFAGREISPDNELNGLALQGVGSGTTLEYIQVHRNKDDGVEFFGGTARAKYMLVTGAGDDQFDWTDGWRGKGQFWVAQQNMLDGDQGFEADNNGEDNDALPRSFPTIMNFTLIGAMNNTNDESDIGMLLREGTSANIHNGIVMNFGDAGIDIDQEATFVNAWSGGAFNGNLVVTKTIFVDNNEVYATDDTGMPFTEQEFIENPDFGNWFLAAGAGVVQNPYDVDAPDFRSAGAAANNDGDDPPIPWFDDVDFIGAVDPANDWTAGWTIAGSD
ncbi:hypothetical protein GF324_09610 [bacterium]|nr:hypothetical protein [bacterium]